MLTSAAVNKYFPESDKMQKGHMRQQHQGVCSTKETHQEDNQLILHTSQQLTREISMNVEDMLHIMYNDKTGQFLVLSSQGNWYIMVLCKTDDKKCEKHMSYSYNNSEAVE